MIARKRAIGWTVQAAPSERSERPASAASGGGGWQAADIAKLEARCQGFAELAGYFPGSIVGE